jgi:hypothetical protein
MCTTVASRSLAQWLSKPVGFLHECTMFVKYDKATWLSKPVGCGQANTEFVDEVLGVQLATVAMQGANPEPHLLAAWLPLTTARCSYVQLTRGEVDT